MIKKERLGALTDGIVAIAATIIVLELTVPNSGHIQDLIINWPTLLAYITSFSLIYFTWYNHNRLIDKAEEVTKSIFIVNGLWIFLWSLIPFVTAWVGNYPYDVAPGVLYAIYLTIYSLSFRIMDNVIVKDNPDLERNFSSRPVIRILMNVGMILAIIIAFYIPIACLFIVLIVNILSAVFLWGK